MAGIRINRGVLPRETSYGEFAFFFFLKIGEAKMTNRMSKIREYVYVRAICCRLIFLGLFPVTGAG